MTYERRCWSTRFPLACEVYTASPSKCRQFLEDLGDGLLNPGDAEESLILADYVISDPYILYSSRMLKFW
jgi:hypothetical protein